MASNRFILFSLALLIPTHSCLAYLDDLNDLENFENFEKEMADTSNDLYPRTNKASEFGVDRFSYDDDGALYDDFDLVRPTRAEKKQKNEEFMRFGRNKDDYLRFGRGFPTFHDIKSPKSFTGKHDESNKRRKRELYHKNVKRSNGSNFMRFGRNPTFMRFGRNMKSILKDLLSKARVMQNNHISV